MGRALSPPPAQGPRGGNGGGPHPGHRPPPPSSSVLCAALRCIASPHLLFLSSSARSFSPGPWPALPLSGPLGAIAVALACSGPPALTARMVGSAAPSRIPRDRPPERGVCVEQYLQDRGFKIRMRRNPRPSPTSHTHTHTNLNREGPGGILGGVSHLPIIKS